MSAGARTIGSGLTRPSPELVPLKQRSDPSPLTRLLNKPIHRIEDERGFTIIEVLVAALIVTIGILGVLKMLDTANAVATVSQSRSQANAVARQIVEASRSLPYRSLSSSSAVETSLKSLQGLADDDASDSLWTIRYRKTVYTVNVFTLCTVDDPVDDVGSHAGASPFFCADSTAQGTVDLNPDDYKRLTVQLKWTDPQGVQRTVRQTTLITNPGAGAGPGVRAGFAMTTPQCATPPTDDDTPPAACAIQQSATEVDQATFTAKTVDPARNLNWSKDNVNQGAATADASCASNSTCSTWTFNWSLGCLGANDPAAVCFDSGGTRIPTTVDGVYLIAAQAFDATANPGPLRAINVTVNRRVPLATPGFIAGWNGTVVELEWLGNVDNDIQRYQVYRMAGAAPNPPPNFGNDVKVCDITSGVTHCQDTSPGPPTGSPQYYLVAYDLDNSGTARPGAETSPYTADPTNNPPTAPTNVACSPCTGNATFTWTPGTDSDGSVAFYRVYRTTTNTPPTVAERYDRTTGPTPAKYVDSDTGSVRFYWFSTVDDSLAESPLVGPIQAGG